MQVINNEIVKVEDGNVVIAQEVCKKFVELNKMKKQFDNMEKLIKSQLLQAMEQNGIKTLENEYFKATYIASKTRKIVDTKALEIIYPEIYQELLKESDVDSSLRMTFKEIIDEF